MIAHFPQTTGGRHHRLIKLILWIQSFPSFISSLMYGFLLLLYIWIDLLCYLFLLFLHIFNRTLLFSLFCFILAEVSFFLMDVWFHYVFSLLVFWIFKCFSHRLFLFKLIKRWRIVNFHLILICFFVYKTISTLLIILTIQLLDMGRI